LAKLSGLQRKNEMRRALRTVLLRTYRFKATVNDEFMERVLDNGAG
jgi:hypothetical protein